MSIRIAFVTNLCPHYRRPLFEMLAERYDVDFFFHSEGDDRFLSSKMRAEEGAFRTVRMRRVTVGRHPLLPGLARRLNRDRYDVVVKCLNGRLMVPYVYGIAKARRLPLVLWTGMWYHPQTLGHRVTRSLTEGVYRGAQAIVAYGDHVESVLAQLPGVEPNKIFVAGQAIQMDRLIGLELGVSEPVVLYVGQLEERKGLDVLIAALARIGDRNMRLRIVGSGSLQPWLEQVAASDSRVELAGYVPQAELPKELANARCLVLPSVTTRHDREPWGLVVNEAFAAGVPAIVTDAVGAAAGGLVRDGRNGAVVAERDHEALARSIERIATNPELARELGMQARVDVAAFTYERMADAFSAAIEHAMAAMGSQVARQVSA